MSRSSLNAASVFALSLFAFAASAQSNLTNDDLIKLAKAGLSDDFVMGQIKQSGSALRSDPASLIALKNGGVNDRLISAVVQKNPPNDPLTSDSVLQLGAA